MKEVKIYGERNSGTNYLRELIQVNFIVKILFLDAPRWMSYPLQKIEFLLDVLIRLRRTELLGWKHGVPPVSVIEKQLKKRDLKIIVVIKNPYTFLLSLHKRPYHSKEKIESFEAFILRPFRRLYRDSLNTKTRLNPIELWNTKNKKYLELKNKFPSKVEIVTYEKLLESPEKTMDLLQKKLSLQPSKDYFKNIEDSTKGEEKRFSDYRTYYLKEQWKGKLSNNCIQTINKHLDYELVNDLCYELL